MNKKKLSVVMAGAMLATSVAPVLAAETTNTSEVSVGQAKLLQNTIEKMMKDGQVSTNAGLALGDATSHAIAKSDADETYTDSALVTDAMAKLMVEGQSKYGVRIIDANGKAVNVDDAGNSGATSDIVYDYKKLEKFFATKYIEAGYTIEVYERTTTDFLGETLPGTAPVKASEAKTYKVADFSDDMNELKDYVGVNTSKNSSTYTSNKLVNDPSSLSIDSEDGNKVVITTNKLTGTTSGSKKTVDLKIGDAKIDGRLALDSDGNLIDITDENDVSKFDHYLTDTNILGSTWKAGDVVNDQISGGKVKKVTSYTYVAEKNNDETLTVSDLYDGLALTSKGTEILNDVQNAAKDVNQAAGTAANAAHAIVQIDDTVDSMLATSGVWSFKVKYFTVKNKVAADTATAEPVKTITVTGTNKEELTGLHKLIKSGNFKVGVVAGANRYETAVNVAKAQGATITAEANKQDIVIVNGTSLVDGLAAAPLAAKLGTDGSVPVLLSKANALPTETKEYIETLTEALPKKTSNNKDKAHVTIHLVGGTSVLNNSVKEELESMGFKVVRHGGDNREETSVKVAEAMGLTGKPNATFVVGGNGESDAMSIAVVAADDTTPTPILVSSVHGLTDEALDFIGANSSEGDVTIIGGESVVSKSEEDKINSMLDDSKTFAERVAGNNRFETNAKVIEKYYVSSGTGKANAVISVKDGIADETELVDALSAATYASKESAPVVLASKEIKDVQKNALLKANNSVAKAIQVGEGSERTVLQTLANLFNLSNLK